MSPHRTSDHYLESIVSAATPAQLRLLLLERAVETAARLASSWRTGELAGPNEHSIKLLDLLTELLSGIQGGETRGEQEVCAKVSDLYVFLAQHLVAAEQHSDAAAIDEIKLVLEAEVETWRLVCSQNTSPPQLAGASAGLNLQG